LGSSDGRIDCDRFVDHLRAGIGDFAETEDGAMQHLDRRTANRRISDFFDRHASNWDEEVASKYPERIAALLSRLEIAGGDRVLDVGAGTGVLVPFLGPLIGSVGSIAAVDLSHAMLRKGVAKGYAEPVLWVQADVLDAPFRVAAFDWVLCYSVFPHFADQGRALHQLGRLLKPGGRLAILHSQSREAINEHHEKVGDVVGGHILPEDKALRELIRRAGLETLHLENREDGFFAEAGKPLA
jgi:demethylmenaquinone methyltransferase/2-methoxy-6-polyprenyl-1,4-benzoquinol methylase